MTHQLLQVCVVDNAGALPWLPVVTLTLRVLPSPGFDVCLLQWPKPAESWNCWAFRAYSHPTPGWPLVDDGWGVWLSKANSQLPTGLGWFWALTYSPEFLQGIRLFLHPQLASLTLSVASPGSTSLIGHMRGHLYLSLGFWGTQWNTWMVY